MNSLKSILMTLAFVLLIGCTSTPALQTGNYKLAGLGQSGLPIDKLVLMNLSNTDLIITSAEHIWRAPVEDNQVGAFYPINRPNSTPVGAFEGMFLNTLQGAKIENTPNGGLKLEKHDRVVAFFEPIEPDQPAPSLGK
jgi:hypothetical protein